MQSGNSVCSWRFVRSIVPTAEDLAQHSHLGEVRLVTITFSQAVGSSSVLKTAVYLVFPIKENCSVFTFVNITSFW